MVISKVEMTLAKVDLQIAEHYVQELTQPEDQERFHALFEQIAEEFRKTHGNHFDHYRPSIACWMAILTYSDPSICAMARLCPWASFRWPC
jgi:hypothetical protein